MITNKKIYVGKGEKDKHEFYAKVFQFPDGITMLPLAIDTYGRIGEEFKDFLHAYCKQAAMGNKQLYSMLVSRARATIELGLATGVGEIVNKAVDACTYQDDRMLLVGNRLLERMEDDTVPSSPMAR